MQKRFAPRVNGFVALWVGLLVIALVAMGMVAGCRKGSAQFGYVEGRVTLDGKPLVQATVEFDPVEGSPSYGITDSRGWYKLRFNDRQWGAVVGKHRVRISLKRKARDPRGWPILVETVPPQYNSNTTLEAEVKPGRQRINFDLTSQPVASR